MEFTARLNPYIFALLRIVAGLLFMMHGTKKLFGFPGGEDPVQFVSQMGLAGVIEFVAGILIVIGLFTRIAAFISSGEMAVAYFIAHAPQGPYPILNQGELAVLYCFLFLYMAVRGAGIWSMDAAFGKKVKPGPRNY